MHMGFCIFATIIYLLEFYRKRSPHYLLMMLAVDATFLVQLFPNSTMVGILAVIEGVLLIGAIVLAVVWSKKRKAQEQTQAGVINEDSDT